MSKALALVARLKQQVATGDLGSNTQVSSTSNYAIVDKDKEGQTRYKWDSDTERLLAWVKDWNPPTEPFVLWTDEAGRPVLTVEVPADFKKGLLIDVAAGPGGTRSRTGALQTDLARLYQLFGR
jgi:hypothetical protein